MKKQAFTLVELIVVITILAILGTIGFISLQGFSSDARDSKRISELSEIRSGLQIYQARNSLLPTPSEQSVTIGSGSTNLIIQGYAGESVLNEIRMNGNPKDPLDDNKYYIYSVNASKTKFQLLSLLENDNNLTSYIVPKTHASYTNRYLYTLGQNIGILLNETTNTPLNELQSGTIDLNTDTNNYKVVFANNNQTSILSGELLYNEIINQTNNNGIAQNNEPESIPITCPTGYILVPNDGNFTTEDFCVAKWEMRWDGNGSISDSTNMYCGDSNSYLNNSCLDGNPGVISQAEGLPLSIINQPDAIQLCNNLGIGYHLITNNEWMTMARNIEVNPQNWADLEVGSLVLDGGGLFRGNVNLDESASCGSNVVLDGITAGTSCEVNGKNKRMHILSNGNEIWDISGNLREHVNGTDNLSSTNGVVENGQACSTTNSSLYAFTDGETIPPSGGTCSFIFPYLKANYGPSGNYNANNGVGRIYSSIFTNRIFARGSAWNGTINAGIFTLALDHDFELAYTSLGFRCAFSIN